MGLPFSSENTLGWRTRYEAVRRWRGRCGQCFAGDACTNDNDFVDFFLAFMVTCYSLRDFVIHTGEVEKGELDKLIQDCEPMRLCRDICNRGKHYAISRPSVDAQWSLGREHIPWSGGKHKYFLIAGGKKYDPLRLVGECERFWGNLIDEKRLVEPTNPFSRKSRDG